MTDDVSVQREVEGTLSDALSNVQETVTKHGISDVTKVEIEPKKTKETGFARESSESWTLSVEGKTE